MIILRAHFWGEQLNNKGEKLAIIEKLKKYLPKVKLNGYITVRFLVNCEGKTGLFRVQQMNADLKKTASDKELGESSCGLRDC